MQDLQQKIAAYEAEINAFEPTNAAELEAFRIQFLGTKGIVKEIFGEMKNVAGPQKKEAGLLLNAFKIAAESKYETFVHLQCHTQNKEAKIDFTLPGTSIPLGTRHPLKMVENKMVSIFEKLGFERMGGES
jgi:phenylalanyl-tRNA synthetase alpha chain